MDDARVEEKSFEDDGSIPNSALPLVLYPGVLEGPDLSAPRCRELFAQNGWSGAWVNGVFPYHHYHSTAHEVLAMAGGEARITFGGPQGETVEVRAGDVVVIPAGVGHCNAGSSRDFTVVGAYPGGMSWDLRTGEPAERPEVLENIKSIPLPDTDPLFGDSGPLLEKWRSRSAP